MSTFEPLAIGRRIAQARHEAGGMTQEELGDLLGVTTRSVQGYEAGDVIPWKHFQRLEEVFQRSLDWFLHGDREPAADRFTTVESQLQEALERLRRVEELLRGDDDEAPIQPQQERG